MITKAKAEANRRWDRVNMVNLCCRVRRDYADRVRQACQDRGDSVNSVLKEALDRYLDQIDRDEE